MHVSHTKCNCEEIQSKLDPSIGDLSFKFEAFVLHVQCRTLDDAQLMVSIQNSAFKHFTDSVVLKKIAELWSSSRV